MMDLNSFLKNHPTLLFAEDMKTICQPLFKLGIDYFSHVMINSQNEMTANASNPEYFRFYFEQGFHQSDLHTAHFDIPQRYVLWHLVKREGKAEELYQSGIEFGLFYIFTVIERAGNEQNYYHFAAKSHKDYMNEFYFRHIDLLEQFIAYYKHSVLLNDRLNRAYKLPYKINNTTGSHIIKVDFSSSLTSVTIRDYLNSIQVKSNLAQPVLELSRRELQCALYLLEGKTSMEIAHLLNLSPRTVEVYFNRLKNRFGSKNKIQLVRHLIETGLLNQTSVSFDV
ncbi:Response regulator containing a CheY-like receiver domain and an HTH DNA-binding domain protein [Legionella moravica]|uniref:Response regulator containing a CheY-like receiver domain and an HTH DNA-binding domain n=1 Tax=Legionella moravica TaxID=39962 RepID=A0A378JTA1_9GAMM|nr:helix-turn-helix transcriptional regulator [Legionella moravica]KTD33471.1 Response regulator containing a CheY-like receiver domain and an HTH DNA-binding domain protein [Legionella moravica]STX61844.1 Response regulator containing a CheY-like receiver domain and an HTH DNA-binding domain [Legionella moravica]